MTNPPYTIDEAVNRYDLVTPGYKEELISGPVEKALKIARAYQRAVELYLSLDQKKVTLWKAIRDRVEASYENRRETSGNVQFTVSTAQTVMGVQPTKEYQVDDGKVAETQQKRWWEDCGVDRLTLRDEIVENLLDPMGRKNSDISAGAAAKKVKINKWKPKSMYVEFGRKVVVLEAAMDTFAEELMLYVLYGGGDVSAVPDDSNRTLGSGRDYDKIRYLVAKDYAKKDDSLGETPSGFDKGSNHVVSPPPSPFLAAIQNRSFDAQVRVVEKITRGMSMSDAGRDFLLRCGTDHAPWKITETKRSKKFWKPLLKRWQKNNSTAIEAIEELLMCNSGFNLLALLDDPMRKNTDGKLVSRAAEPGTRWSDADGMGQVKWLHWNGSKFVTPTTQYPGTIFRYRDRQDATYNGNKRYFKRNTWEVMDNEGGKRLQKIALRLMSGGAELAGRNAKKPESESVTPKRSFEGLEFENEEASKNCFFQVAISYNTIVSGIGKAASGSQLVVDYIEETGDAIHQGQIDLDDTKIYKWIVDNETLNDIANDLGSDGIETMKAGVPMTLAGGFVLLTVGDALASSDKELTVADVISTTDLVVQSFSAWGDVGANNYAHLYKGLSGQWHITDEAAKEAVDGIFEKVGIVLGLAEATWNAWQSYGLYSKGNYSKAAAVGVLGVMALATTGAGYMATAGTVQPWLYLVAGILVGASLVVSVIAATLSWSDLENWLDFSYFGITRPNKGPQKPNPVGPWGDYQEETTEPGGEYYGFEGDYSRQLSYLQSVPLTGTVNNCWVGYGDSELETNEYFVLDIKKIQGLSEKSELLVCALPGDAKELYPLFTFPMSVSKGDPFFDTTAMPNGMTFNTPDTMHIETYTTPTSGDRFTIKCSKGKNLTSKSSNEDDPKPWEKVNEFFTNHFMSRVSAEDYGGHDWSPSDWGWEILYYPRELPDTFRRKLADASKQTDEARDLRKMLFSQSLPRKRIWLQIPSGADNYWGKSEQMP